MQVPLRLPNLASGEGHTVQLLVPVTRPGQVRMTARLLYRTDQVRLFTELTPCDVLHHLSISQLQYACCLVQHAHASGDCEPHSGSLMLHGSMKCSVTQ